MSSVRPTTTQTTGGTTTPAGTNQTNQTSSKESNVMIVLVSTIGVSFAILTTVAITVIGRFIFSHHQHWTPHRDIIRTRYSIELNIRQYHVRGV